jgi:hypothetical protein
VLQPPDLGVVQARDDGETAATEIGIANLPPNVQQLMTRSDRFRDLHNKEENRRLHAALMNKFGITTRSIGTTTT